MDHPSRRKTRWTAPASGVQSGRTSLAPLGLALLLAAATPTACVSAGDASVAARPAAPTTPGERDTRIRELEAAISVEEEALRVLISAERSEGDDPLHSSDEMRDIAHRLPTLQDELRGLLRAREIAAPVRMGRLHP